MDDGDQVESTVQQLAELHDAHRREATRAQRLANRVTETLGRPGALMIVIVLVILWMIGNYAATRAGVGALEGAPFPELGLIVTLVALLVALLILTTQRHEQTLAEKQAPLTIADRASEREEDRKADRHGRGAAPGQSDAAVPARPGS